MLNDDVSRSCRRAGNRSREGWVIRLRTARVRSQGDARDSRLQLRQGRAHSAHYPFVKYYERPTQRAMPRRWSRQLSVTSRAGPQVLSSRYRYTHDIPIEGFVERIRTGSPPPAAARERAGEPGMMREAVTRNQQPRVGSEPE